MTVPISIQDLLSGNVPANNQPKAPISIADLMGEQEEQESPFAMLADRFKHLWMAYKVSTGNANADELIEIGNAAIAAEGSRKGMFASLGRDVINTLASLDDYRRFGGALPRPGEKPSPTLGQILSGITAESLAAGIPDVFSALVSKPIEAATGVGLDRDTLYGMTPEERAQAIKDSAANIAMFAASAGVGAAMTKQAVTQGAKAIAASKGVKGALQVGRQAQSGAVKRAMMRGIAEGAVGGTVQSGISALGDESIGTQMLVNGVLFAPFGAAFEAVRFARPKARDVFDTRTDVVGRRIAEMAGDAAQARMLQITTKDSYADILFKLDALESSNSIAEAIVKGRVRARPDNPIVVPGVSQEVLGQVVSSLARGETKVIPQFYKRPDGLYDMLAASGRLSDKATRSFRETGLIPNQLVEVDGVAYRFTGLSKDGQRIRLINPNTGRPTIRARSTVRIRTDLETHDVTSTNVVDRIWDDFRAFALADADGQPTPQPSVPNLKPTDPTVPVTPPPPLLKAPSHWERMKSSIGRFIQDESGTLRMTGTDEELLFSRTENVIKSFQPRAQAKQWLNQLEKSSPKFEREWTEIDEWLKSLPETQMVTREELLAKFNENAIEVNEVMYGGAQYAAALAEANYWRDEVYRLDAQVHRSTTDPYGLDPETSPAYQQLENARLKYYEANEKLNAAGNPSLYDAYTEEGGSNYRSIVLTLGLNEKKNQVQLLRSLGVPEERVRFQQNVHWDDYDVLGWARMKDYTLPNGERLLYVEEIQSDWFQEMRESGVREPVNMEKLQEAKQHYKEANDAYVQLLEKADELDTKMQDLLDKGNARLNEGGSRDGLNSWTGLTAGEEAAYNALKAQWDDIQYRQRFRLEDDLNQAERGVRKITRDVGLPDAPFKKTEDWMGLVLKRILAEAAHGGYDRVAFSGPMHQYLRWGSDAFQWRKLSDDTFEITGYATHQGDPNADLFNYSYNDVYDVRNKDDLDRPLQQYLHKWSESKAARLKEEIWKEMQANPEGHFLPRKRGMEAVYGRVLPNVVKDLMKKLGFKTEFETINIPEFAAKEARARFGNLGQFIEEDANPVAPTNHPLAVQSIRVPPELRTKIIRDKQPLGFGQPAVVAGLAGAGISATAGMLTGDTPEERERNMLLYGAAGAFLAAGGVSKLMNRKPKAYTPPAAPPVAPLMDATPRSQFQSLLDRFADSRGYSQQERGVLEREMTDRFYKETYKSLPPEERAVIDRLNQDIESTVLQPGGSRLEQAQIAAKVASSEVIRKANSNGMYVDEEAAGNLILRDAASDRIVGRFKSTADAIEFIDKSGQADGVDLDGGNGNMIPPRIGSGLIPIDDGPASPMDVPWATRPGGGFVDLFNTTFDYLTPNRNIITSLDSKFGTQFFARIYDTTQVARMKANAAIRPWYEKLKKIDEIALKMSKADREMTNAYLEAYSPDEIKATGGPGGRPLNPTEIQLGELFASQSIDLLKVQKYLREVDRIHRELSSNKIDQATANQLITDAQQGFSLDANHLAAARSVSGLRGTGAGFFGPVARLANAIMNKDVSRADFARANKMSGKQLQMAHEMEKLFRDLAGAFNIPDTYRLQDLMTHARLYSRGNLGAALRDFDMPAAVKDFFESLSRTGELSAMEKDPVRSLQRYIKAGFDSKLMLPALEKARQALPEELAKLDDQTSGKTKTVVERYLHDVSGIPAEATKFTQAGVEHYLNKLGLNIPVNVREDIVNLILATGEAAMQGFRVVAGLRDFTQGVAWYYSRFGLARTLKFLEYGTKGLNGITKADLQARGLIPELDVLFFTTPTEFTGTNLGRASNVIGRTLRNISHVGLKWSGQKDVYAMMHAGAYLDTWKRTGDTLTKLSRGEISKKKAYNDLLIDTYELPTVNEFDRLVREQKLDDAARLLARETAREQVGTFGSGNNPGGWNRNIGRIAGQYGSWSMWFRAQLMRSMSRGTYAQRGAALLRLAATQGAIVGTSTALGVNLATWYAPTGAIFTGGPLVDAATTVAEAIQGTGYVGEVARARLRRYLPYDPWADEFNIGQIYIPGSYFANDLLEAYQMASEGEGPRAMARAIGVRPAE